MKFQFKLILLVALTCLAISAILLMHPVAQNPSFHLFADTRTIAFIPNFFNVITNLPFIIIGIYGLILVGRSKAEVSVALIYSVLFVGIILTGLGSAYYHYNPDNNTLVYDRIPMTIVFMSFLSATIAKCINIKAGAILLFPLVLTGIASVLWWRHTEAMGAGDLRLYGLVQFYPVVFIPLIFLLFPVAGNRKILGLFIWIIGWYVIAKLLEHFDKSIFDYTENISGHSLKHLAAAMSTWYIVKIFRDR